MANPIYAKSAVFTGFGGLVPSGTYAITSFSISPTTIAQDEHLDMCDTDMIVDYDEGKVTYGQLTVNFDGPPPSFTQNGGKLNVSINVAGLSVFSGKVRPMEYGGVDAQAKGKITSSVKFQICR